MYERTPDLASVRKTMDNFSDSLRFIGTGTGAYKTPKASQPQFTTGVYEGLHLYDRRPIAATSPVSRRNMETMDVVEVPVIREIPASYIERREPTVVPARYSSYTAYEPVEMDTYKGQTPVIVRDKRHHKKHQDGRRQVHYQQPQTVSYMSLVEQPRMAESSGGHINELLFSKNPSLRMGHHQNRRRSSGQQSVSLRSSLNMIPSKDASPHEMFLPEDVKMLYLNPEMIKKDFKEKVDLDCDQVDLPI